MKNVIVTAALLASAAAAQALPIPYAFSYVAGAGTLSGLLMGELQPDHNTVVISLVSAKFNDVAGPALPVVMSVATLFGGSFKAASTTLDGSVQDIYAANSFFGDSGFALIAGNAGLPSYLAGTYISGKSFGETQETYVAANWSISAYAPVTLPGIGVSPVPEPGAPALMLAGLALLIGLWRPRDLLA